MLKILVPVDGSETADRAVNHLLKLRQAEQPARPWRYPE